MRRADRTLPHARRLRWSHITLAAGIHAGCLAAPFCFSWSALAVCLVLGWVSCGVGITLGWHRLLTHRSYQTFKPIEYLLTLVGCLAWQMGPIEWVGTHRLHHAHTDEADDPHSPRGPSRGWAHRVRGFLWSHAGWAFVHPPIDRRSAANDLRRDRVIAAIDRVAWLPGLLLVPLLYAAGETLAGPGQGLPWLVWGTFVRTALMYHATWFVNSASHTWGYRNFETADASTNLWWVALIAFGEGWHNNHHAQPRSAAHGMKRWELDPTWALIRMMRGCGLSWNVIEPKPAPAGPTQDPPTAEQGS